MRRRWSLVSSIVVPLVSTAGAPSPILVRVGDTPFTVLEVESLLQGLPPARLPAGATPREVVQQLVVPELLWRHHAEVRSVSPGEVRDRALARAMQARLAASAQVSDAEVAAFYEQNSRHFSHPEAISVWRIVTDSESSAREVLEAVRGQAKGIEIWSKLARDRSLDTATKMRRGDLGFVEPDGQTHVPEVRVNPAVYELASKLEDGQLAEHPLRDGDHHSAIWRRGSIRARQHSLAEARGEIVGVLRGRRADVALDELVDRLRREHVTRYQPDDVETVEYALPTTPNRRRPLAPRPSEGSPTPTAGPDGER